MTKNAGQIVGAVIATVVLASVAASPSYAATTNELLATFNFCVRSTAVRLEPSGDEPEAVAKAAVFVCLPEEQDAVNSALKDNPARITPMQIRDTAIFFGASQVVLARLCRKTKDCILPPPLISPRSLQAR